MNPTRIYNEIILNYYINPNLKGNMKDSVGKYGITQAKCIEKYLYKYKLSLRKLQISYLFEIVNKTRNIFLIKIMQ
jgi:hypothetical protein